MKIAIETYGSCNYEEISNEYGKILRNFGLFEEDGFAYIKVHKIEELFLMHSEISKYVFETEKCLPYFGLVIKSYDDGTPYLEIKDNYD